MNSICSQIKSTSHSLSMTINFFLWKISEWIENLHWRKIVFFLLWLWLWSVNVNWIWYANMAMTTNGHIRSIDTLVHCRTDVMPIHTHSGCAEQYCDSGVHMTIERLNRTANNLSSFDMWWSCGCWTYGNYYCLCLHTRNMIMNYDNNNWLAHRNCICGRIICYIRISSRHFTKYT